MLLAAGLAGCATDGFLPVLDSSNPTDPAAGRPTAEGVAVRSADIAQVETWVDGGKPEGAEGTQVQAFAGHLNQPSDLYVLPNGDVLVAEADADASGVYRITLLRDTDADGAADLRSVLVRDLAMPTGMALLDGTLFVATDQTLLKFPYRDGQLRIEEPAEAVARFPRAAEPWSGDVAAGRRGATVYVASTAAGERQGFAAGAGAIRTFNAEFGESRLHAKVPGTPVGMDWELERATLWALVAAEGADQPARLVSVDEAGASSEDTEAPADGNARGDNTDPPAAHALPDVPAPSDLVNGFGNTLPARFAHGMFIGQHGVDGGPQIPEAAYGVVFVPFRDARPAGEPLPVLGGFVVAGDILGRPVAVAVDSHGALLVADDVGNIVWRVTSAPAPGVATTP